MSDLKTYQEALKKASATIERLLGENERLRVREPVAIIGMGCRLPGGANSPEEYWRLLAEGRDAVSAIPPERWPADYYFAADPEAPGKMYVREGGFLDVSPYDFEPRFFGISPKEAKALDPQQRLLLETAWEALEDAGIAPASLQGSRTGVFIGISSNDYDSAHLRSGEPALIDPYTLTGFTFSTAAGRISYTLGLEGPSFPVDTACSSSLVALHLARRSLASGECDLALVGGVNLMLTPEPLIAFCKLRALSPDGRCKTFDAGADGYGRGEGCGVLVLKRLAAAQRDGDRILALVKGSALNNDGRSNGLTAPNGLAQRRVIAAALADAVLQPADIDYLEAHGTGTPLGDPVEVEAIAAALGQGRDDGRPLLIGSAKTNIGHLEAAAGIAGLIKLVLSLGREQIPPHLHFCVPNAHIDWDNLPLKVAAAGAAWPRGPRPRRAGISGFGFSGTNAHVILEEAPSPPAPALADGRGSHLLVLSAGNDQALRAMAGRFGHFLEGSEPPLGALCNTAATGRNHFPYALAVSGSSPAEMSRRLLAHAAGGEASGLWLRPENASRTGGPVFLFTGQGSQYPGMGEELYQSSPVYREILDRCDRLFAPLLDRSIRDLMHGGSAEELTRTSCTQPAIFSLEYALAGLWQSWGVTPSAVLGHSIGEFVAACVAGVLSLEDAVTLVAHRGRLMDALPGGGVMAAALCPEAQALPVVDACAGVAIAAVNAPGIVVLSGEAAGVAAALEALRRQGVSCQYLSVSHAFHSQLMDAALDPFEQIAAGLTYHAPTLPIIANVTGRPARGDDLRSAAYWRRQLRGAVRFSDSIAHLREQGHDLFLEIGATATLSSFVRRIAGAARCVPSLLRGTPPWATLVAALGELFAAGVDIDWQGYDVPYRAGKVSIPTYPFQRERHIMNPVRQSGGSELSTEHVHGRRFPLLGALRDSPSSTEERFSNVLDTVKEPWLSGHSVLGAVVMPAAGYLEMALAAGGRALPPGTPLLIEGIEILAPLLLSADVTRTENLFRPGEGLFESFSRSGDGWTLHARMNVLPLAAAGFPLAAPLAPLPAAPPTAGPHSPGIERDQATLYADFFEQGYACDGVFRSIRRLFLAGGEIHGLVEVPATAAAGFSLHPALLDGCLGLAGASLLYDKEPPFVPTAIDALHFSGKPATSLAVHCRLRERTAHRARYDLAATDASGDVVLRIDGLVLRRISREQLTKDGQGAADPLLYRVDWREAPMAVARPLSGRWVLLTDHSPAALAVRGALLREGVEVTEIPSGDDFLPNMERLTASLQGGEAPVAGIVSFMNGSIGGHLHLVRGMLAAQLFAPLVLVTAGVQDPTGAEREIFPDGAGIWGFGAALAAEAPEFSPRLVDLSPWPTEEECAAFLGELVSADGEERVALRAGRRFVPRLRRAALPAGREELLLPAADGFHLDVEERGSLEGICVRARGRRPPAPGEVEIRVRAAGLNFRDVLNVLGTYPGDAGTPGFECSGELVAVGAEVEGLLLGDRVLVFNVDACIADYLTVSRRHLLKMPELWSFEEAAAVPVAFLTAWYGLHHLARVKEGDRVLIHAAAGGVGLAAVQLALAAGAEIFATAGTPEKRALLARLGVRQVMDSRSLAYGDAVMAATDRCGVDIVINSLAGEHIDRSLSLLAAGGRFIEIGKADIRDEAAVQETYPGRLYRHFDLGRISEEEPALLSEAFAALLPLFAQESLKPLPMTIFAVKRAREAFRFMAQARHIGKVVISLADRIRERRLQERGLIDPAGTCLVTGGLGALGLAVARWLADQGCRHLVLVGRSVPSPAAAAEIEELRGKGAGVEVMRADVADQGAVLRLTERLRTTMPPLKGVFHAAGILDDAMLAELDHGKLERVMAPKLLGARNLHQATMRDDLDHFVLFSSLAAIAGSPGQANYAAANAALDGFARWRRSRGLAAVSIGWGPWREAGMAARGGNEERLAARGIRSIDARTALRAFGAVLREAPGEMCVADLDLPRLASFVPAGGGLYAELFAGEAAPSDLAASVAAAALDGLRQAVPAQRFGLMLAQVRALAARVMGQSDPARIESARPLQEQGFDSLMAVDLRNLIARTFGAELPVSLLFDYPTPEKIGRFLLEEVLVFADREEPLAGEDRLVLSSTEKSADQLVDEIERLLAG